MFKMQAFRQSLDGDFGFRGFRFGIWIMPCCYELLRFDESVHVAVRKLSAKWAAEPSVRGGKRRPDGTLAV